MNKKTYLSEEEAIAVFLAGLNENEIGQVLCFIKYINLKKYLNTENAYC